MFANSTVFIFGKESVNRHHHYQVVYALLTESTDNTYGKYLISVVSKFRGFMKMTCWQRLI